MRYLAFLLALGLASAAFGQDKSATYKALDRFGDVLDLAVEHSLSAPKAADLVAAAIDGLLAKYPSEKAAAAAAKTRTGDKAHLDRIGAVFDVLAKEHAKTVPAGEFADTAINAMLAHLGPRNSFINASQTCSSAQPVMGGTMSRSPAPLGCSRNTCRCVVLWQSTSPSAHC